MPRKKKYIGTENAVTYRLVRTHYLDESTPDDGQHVWALAADLDKFERSRTEVPEFATFPAEGGIPFPIPKRNSPLEKHIPAKGPQPDPDPDIVRALDDDFDHEDPENALEDDFIAMANAPIEESQFPDDASESGSEGSWESDDGYSFSDDDPLFHGRGKGKSDLTEYPMTSAISNCPEEVQIFNERFEKLCEAYTDDQIGDLDLEVIEGGSIIPDSKIVKELAEDLHRYKEVLYAYDNDLDADMKEKIQQSAEMPEEEKRVKIVVKLPPEYDCESIRSLYSNKYNHPTVIKMEKKEKPRKISTNLQKNRLTKSNLKQLDREVKTKEEDEESDDSDNNETVVSTCNLRPKDETPEERRIRKAAVKQIRKENRIIKKENKLAFKEEKKKQTSVALNAKRNRVVHLF